MTTQTMTRTNDVAAILELYESAKRRADTSGARACQEYRDFLSYRDRVIRPALTEVVARLRVAGFPCMLHQSTSQTDAPSITFSALNRSIIFRAHDVSGAQIVGGPWGENLARDVSLESITAELIREYALEVAKCAGAGR